MTLRERFATLNATTSATAKEWGKAKQAGEIPTFYLLPSWRILFLLSWQGRMATRNDWLDASVVRFLRRACHVCQAVGNAKRTDR